MSPLPLDYRSPDERTNRPRCPACGSELTVVGTLAGDVGFKPRKIRKLFSVSGTVIVDAIACTACGVVTLCADRNKLVDLAGDPEEPPAT